MLGTNLALYFLASEELAFSNKLAHEQFKEKQSEVKFCK